ncbi:MAG: tetratricopeptide repeat protein, partial [Desulfovibrionaceae bacterium]|nr:tetratricopeptide repeat protein [Desulfovibrionaceae bacterium]
QLYPLIIRYNPGKEKELLEAMRELLVELQRVVTENAQQDLAEIERRKQEGLQKGQELIDRGEYDEARRVFDQLVGEFQSDTDLKADIADRFLKVERYEDALVYLEEALRHDPNAIYLYNRIGIVLRKMRDFETAEKYYKKALEISAQDEYLHFNIGRLYIDWQKWDKVREAAEKALKVNPEFAEAHKMLAFASRKLGG